MPVVPRAIDLLAQGRKGETMNGWRPHIESALCLSLPRLLQTRSLRPGCSTSGVLEWKRGGNEHVASIGYRAALGERDGTLSLDYAVNGQPEQCAIRLSTVTNNYGGVNWYMHCPVTGRRARKLYKWAGLASFLHREAIRSRPTYASQRDSGFDRVTRQRWELRQKMGDKWSDLFGEPFKPKGMRQRTFYRYRARDAALAERQNAALASFIARMPGLGRGD